MNIPLAYDVLPSEGTPGSSRSNSSQAAQSAVVVNAPAGYTYGTGVHVTQGGGELGTALLLSDQEQQWQQEMAAEGIAHLPLSWYRQTPQRAVWGAYGLINRIISGLFNFGLNVGIGYAILHNNDEVGLWQQPTTGEHPYKSAMFSDLLLTTVLIAFLTCLISTPLIRMDLKKGKTVPVENHALDASCMRCTPVRLLGTCSRSVMLSLWALLCLALPFIAGLELVCVAGGMHDSGAMCSMGAHAYIWIKAAYSFVVAFIVYPLVLLGTLNVHTLPPLDLTFFNQNQKERWEEEQREKANNQQQQLL